MCCNCLEEGDLIFVSGYYMCYDCAVICSAYRIENIRSGKSDETLYNEFVCKQEGNMKYLTTTTAAARLGVSQETVRRYLKNGRLIGEKIGSQNAIHESSVEELLLSMKAEPDVVSKTFMISVDRTFEQLAGWCEVTECMGYPQHFISFSGAKEFRISVCDNCKIELMSEQEVDGQ